MARGKSPGEGAPPRSRGTRKEAAPDIPTPGAGERTAEVPPEIGNAPEEAMSELPPQEVVPHFSMPDPFSLDRSTPMEDVANYLDFVRKHWQEQTATLPKEQAERVLNAQMARVATAAQAVSEVQKTRGKQRAPFLEQIRAEQGLAEALRKLQDPVLPTSRGIDAVPDAESVYEQTISPEIRTEEGTISVDREPEVPSPDFPLPGQDDSIFSPQFSEQSDITPWPIPEPVDVQEETLPLAALETRDGSADGPPEGSTESEQTKWWKAKLGSLISRLPWVGGGKEDDSDASSDSSESEATPAALTQLSDADDGSIEIEPTPAMPEAFNVQEQGPAFIVGAMPVSVDAPAAISPTIQETPEDKTERRKYYSTQRAENFVKNEQSLSQIQDAYFTALKEEQRKRGGFGVVAESLVGRVDAKKVRLLRQDWIASRANLARDLRNGAYLSLESKYGGVEEKTDEGGKADARGSEEYREAVLRRYERRFIVPAAVLGAEEAELAARKEGLSQRDKKTFDAIFDRYKALPAWKRTLTTAAVLTGGVAAGTMLAGGTAAVGAATLGITAWTAAAQWLSGTKNSSSPRLAKFVERLALLPSIVGGAGGALSEKGVKAAHSALGTKKKAQETLAKKEDLGDITSAKGLGKVSKRRRAALEVDESIARHGRAARAIGSLAAGVAAGSWVRDELAGAPEGTSSSAEGGAVKGDSPATAPAAPEQLKTPSSVEASTAQPIAPEQQAAPGASTESAAPARNGVNTPVEGFSAKIEALVDERGEGTNRLFTELKQAVTAAGIENPSPALKHLLESDPNELSRAMGEASYGERGMITHNGDRLFVDDKQNVWFEAEDGKPQLYLESKADGSGFIEHEVTGKPLPSIETASEPAASRLDDRSINSETPAAGSPREEPPNGRSLNTNLGAVLQEGTNQDLGTIPGAVSIDALNQAAGGATELGSAAESTTDSVYVNRNGIEISQEVPTPYTWQPPGAEGNLVVVHGGSGAEAEAAARVYAAAHPGETAVYVTQERGGFLGLGKLRDVVHGVQVDAAGKMQVIETLRYPDGRTLPLPDPNEFTRSIKP